MAERGQERSISQAANCAICRSGLACAPEVSEAPPHEINTQDRATNHGRSPKKARSRVTRGYKRDLSHVPFLFGFLRGEMDARGCTPWPFVTHLAGKSDKGAD